LSKKKSLYGENSVEYARSLENLSIALKNSGNIDKAVEGYF
jgi:hypothetical protein